MLDSILSLVISVVGIFLFYRYLGSIGEHEFLQGSRKRYK